MTSERFTIGSNASHYQEGVPFTNDELLLLQGFSAPALRNMIGVTSRTVRARQSALREGGVTPPDMSLLTSQVALLLAQRRGRAQLPYCARLSILDHWKWGHDRKALARMFRCSKATVARVLRHEGWRYPDHSGVPRFTQIQRRPPAAWSGQQSV